MTPSPEVEVLEPDLSGEHLGPWQLEKILGEGSMGRVYLARHDRIGRRAAVKVLKVEHATNAELINRFIQEAQAVNAIKNDHIVEVYDFGELRRPDQTMLVYCVMELLEGEALSDTLNQGPLHVRRVARIGQQLGLALGAAHRVGVVHRDIKPENIMVCSRGTDADFVKVLDFGVAKLLKPIGNLPQTGTLAGIVVGTPEYMAPEQALGMGADLRSDLYSVGLVMYELLTGTQPFHADTFGKLIVEMTQKPPPKLPAITRLGEAVPRGLAAVINKLLSKDPEARYQSGDELAAALEAFTADLLPAEPPAPPSSEVEPEVLSEFVTLKPSRTPWLVLALVLAVGTGMAMWALSSGEPQVVVPAPPALVEVPTTVALEVMTKPAGASVTRLDTGELLGVTPLKAQVAVAELTGLNFELEGFEAERRDVKLSTNVTLSVDLKPRLANAPLKVAPPAVKRGDGRGERKKIDKKKVNNDGTVDPFAE